MGDRAPADRERPLGEQVHDYVDGAAPPITLDEIRAAAPVSLRRDGDGPRAKGRWLAAVAAVVAVVTVGGVLATRDAPPEELRAGSPTDTTTVTTDLPVPPKPLVVPEVGGAETAMAAVPEGWVVHEVGDLRWAMPPDWTTPRGGFRCTFDVMGSGGVDPGVVMVQGTEVPLFAPCDPAEPQPANMILIDLTESPPVSGAAVRLGTWEAREGPLLACTQCARHDRLANGYTIEAGGPDVEAVLATFTDSGRRRVFQAGPVADTTGWRNVEYEGIGFRVPADWPVTDLPSTYSETRRGDGVISMSGQLDPGQCDGSPFPPGSPGVSLGSSGFTASCPYVPFATLEPGDGIWVRPVEPAAVSSFGVPEIEVDGAGVHLSVLPFDREEVRGQTVLELAVRAGERTFMVSLGVGLDASIARAILRSLHAAG